MALSLLRKPIYDQFSHLLVWTEPSSPFNITHMLDNLALFFVFLTHRWLIDATMSPKTRLGFSCSQEDYSWPTSLKKLPSYLQPVLRLPNSDASLPRAIRHTPSPPIRISGQPFKLNASALRVVLLVSNWQVTSTLLSLSDVSSAFDIVDHAIWFQRLGSSYGLNGFPLLWLQS